MRELSSLRWKFEFACDSPGNVLWMWGNSYSRIYFDFRCNVGNEIFLSFVDHYTVLTHHAQHMVNWNWPQPFLDWSAVWHIACYVDMCLCILNLRSGEVECRGNIKCVLAKWRNVRRVRFQNVGTVYADLLSPVTNVCNLWYCYSWLPRLHVELSVRVKNWLMSYKSLNKGFEKRKKNWDWYVALWLVRKYRIGHLSGDVRGKWWIIFHIVAVWSSTKLWLHSGLK